MRDESADYLPPIDMLEAAHVEQRAKERFGANLSGDDRASMKAQIQECRAIFVTGKTGNRRVKVWLVWWESAQRIVPIYYHEGRIKSVLPASAVPCLFARVERDRASGAVPAPIPMRVKGDAT